MRFLIIDNDYRKVNFIVSYLNSICGERVSASVPQTYIEALKEIKGLIQDTRYYSHIIISSDLPDFDFERKMINSGETLLKVIKESNMYIPVIDCTTLDMDKLKSNLQSAITTNTNIR